MLERCLSCQAAVPAGVEICEACCTRQIPKLNLESLSGPAAAQLKGSALLSTRSPREESDDVHFCGRSQELAQLGAMVERSLKQEKLHCALVHAAPGLGKSRLLRELRRLITAHLGLSRDRILTGIMPGEAASPMSALAEQLRTRCDIESGEQPQTAREKLLRTCRTLLPAVRATEVAHSLGELIGIPFPENQFTGLQAQSGQTPTIEPDLGKKGEPRTYVALKRFLTADAMRAPLVLLFDEMEHATDETLSLLHYLVESLTELPVFVGLFARSEFLEQNPDCGSSTGGLFRIELLPMPPADITELFCAATSCEPEEVPEELLAYASENAEGSPRKITELCRLLVESESLIFENGAVTWNTERLRELGLPPDLDMEGLIAARLAVMPPKLRALLEKAAVSGEHFYFDALLMLERCEEAGLATGEDNSDVVDPEGPALDDLLQTGDRTALLERVELLLQKGLLRGLRDSRLRGEREYRFAYPPWQKLVYNSVPSSRRRHYHHLLAHWMLLHKEHENEETLEIIGRHMERAGRNSAAAYFYRRVAQMASARFAHTKPPRLLLRALSCLGSADIGMRLGLWGDLGAALLQKGDFDAAFGAYEKLLRLAHALAMRQYLAQAHYALGQIYRHRGEPSVALEHLTRALDEYTELSDSHGISDALDDLGQVLWLLGRTPEALDRAGRALELRRRLGDRRKVALSLLRIGAIEQHRGLLEPAIGCYEEALRKHDGDAQILGACLESLGSIDLLRGDLDGARARFEQGIGLVEPFGPSVLLAVLMCRLGETLLQAGHLSEAESRLLTAQKLALRLSDRRALAEISRLLGLVHLRRDEGKAALDCCQRALDQAQRNGMRHEIARALLTLGEVHASTLFDETVEGAHPAWDCFRRSVTLLREVGDQAELAIALYQLGRHLIERGRLGPARNTLREAEQIAVRLHMRQAGEMQQMLAEL